MGRYTAAITTMVQTEFPTPTYTVGAQNDLITFLDTPGVASLVDTSNIADEYVQEYTDALNASNYQYVPKTNPLWQKLLDACEATINIVKGDSAVNPQGGVKFASIVTDQAGTADPTISKTFQSNIGAVTAKRDLAGEYHLSLPLGSIPNPAKVRVEFPFASTLSKPAGLSYGVAGDNISFSTKPMVADLITGAVTWAAAADDLLSDQIINIWIYP